MSHFGEAPGSLIDWIDTRIETGFSNFVYIDEHFYSCPVLRRIFSIARKLGYQSLLQEELSEQDSLLLLKENAMLALRAPDFKKSKVIRLCFFRTTPDQQPNDACGDCLGYAVFKIDHFSGAPQPKFHIYEAVMRPSRSERGNNFIHCSKHFTVSTTIGRFSVEGALYAQQNDLTFVCAHVALRTVIAAASPNNDSDYCQINQLLGIDHTTRQLGSSANAPNSGLDRNEMEAVFKHCGLDFTTTVHEPGTAEFTGEFQRELYSSIESGMPALLGFELDPAPNGSPQGRHIIPVLGHTFNEDTWVADASRAYFEGGLQYYSSESWLSTYVTHDDNFGPYLCLPRHFIRKKNFRISFGLLRSSQNMTAVDAEAVGLDFCNALAKTFAREKSGWLGRFAAFANTGLLVLRTIQLQKREYLEHLKQSTSWNGARHPADTLAQIEATLPEHFWLIEASAPELFAASRRKFGEVLIDTTIAPNGTDPTPLWLGARLPSAFFIQQNKAFHTLPSGIQSHTELFQFNTTPQI